ASGQFPVAGPVEGRARIGLAAWRDVAVTDHLGNGIAAAQSASKPRHRRVLRALVGDVVRAFQLDADGKSVAVRASSPAGAAGVPSAQRAWNELNETSVAPDQEMRRDAQLCDPAIVRMRPRIEPIGEELDDGVAAEPSRRKRDVMNDQQRDDG